MGDQPLVALHWLALVQHELLLFAGVFFLIGAIDEVLVDFMWFRLKLSGRTTLRIATEGLRHRRLRGRAAVLIPAWREERVIGHTIAHALSVWPQSGLRLYIGCYRNDPATVQAAIDASGNDPRLRVVLLDQCGPTSKAGCLNRLYAAMELDERRSGERVRMVLLHDAEDMVDPVALALLDQAIADAEFVQLPVLPHPQSDSRWIGSHYCEEFAESHGKAMVVRSALATGLPAAGVGCAFARDILGAMTREPGAMGPFAEGSLTEDYEMGLRVAALGGRSRFLRVRGEDGRLVATRAFFPSTIDSAVTQKARWIHGIAFQAWDRLGWTGGAGEFWMRLRDRRGPLGALVLSSGYLLLILTTLSAVLVAIGIGRAWQPSGVLPVLLWLNFISFAWRAAMRFGFTAREYGALEGIRAVLRIPVTNVIAIMAGRRALFAYGRTLRGAAPHWDKTTHDRHPAITLRAVPQSAR